MSEPVNPITVEEVRAAITARSTRPVRPLRNLTILLVTAGLFLLLPLASVDASTILIVLAVLFIHESGHFLGMKFFGYRDVRMFFIPMLGAAVSGTPSRPDAAKCAVVSLLGPVPGLLLAPAAAAMYANGGGDHWLTWAKLLALLNATNLLPFFPLDGGRIVDALVTSRWPQAERVFKLCSVGVLFWAALAIGSWVLGIFAFLILAGLKSAIRTSEIARNLRRAGLGGDCATDEIPEPALVLALDALEREVPHPMQRDQAVEQRAESIQSIWETACMRPAGLWNSVGLLLVYALSILGGTALSLFTLMLE